MKLEHFGEFKTGLVIPINPEGRFHDFAFVPNSLGPNWEPDRSLWPLIAEARERVGTLNGTGGILPTPSLLLRPLQRREAIKSNSIEGTYVTPEELLLFEVAQKRDTAGDERRNDWQEVTCYDWALNEGVELVSQGQSFDRRLFCDLHVSLMQNARGRDKTPGQIRDMQVYVEAGRRYIPPPAEYLGHLLANLEEYLHSDHCDPLVRAFIAHYQFEAIHPFKDGNGRIGRLILSLCIYKWLNHSHAWLYLSEFFDRNRKEYINRLYAVSTSGEWDEWVKFCLIGAIEQADLAVATCKKLDDIKKKYEQSVGHLSSRMNSIITYLLSEPFLEVSRFADRLGVAYNTVRSDVDKLVEYGVLRELVTAKRKTFYAHEFYDVAYGD